MTELAVLLGVEQASVIGLVYWAERRGLVRRALAPYGQRASRAHLSEQCELTEALFRASVACRFERLTAGLLAARPLGIET